MLSLGLILKKGVDVMKDVFNKDGNVVQIDLSQQIAELGNRLTTKEAAAYLRLQAHTLAVWRLTGRYELPFQKIGRRVFYLKSDLDAWAIARSGTHTGAI